MPYIAYLPNSRVTLLDLDEVAEVLNVSRKTAYRYCKSGKLPSNSVSGQVMVSEETLLAFLMAQNHRNPRLAPANMLPVGRRWNRPNLQSFRQTI